MLTRAYVGWKENVAVMSVTLLTTSWSSWHKQMSLLSHLSTCNPLKAIHLVKKDDCHQWLSFINELLLHSPAITSKQTLKTSWCSSTPPKTTLMQLLLPIHSGFYKSLMEPTLASNFPCSSKSWPSCCHVKSPHHGLSLLSIILLVSSSTILYILFMVQLLTSEQAFPILLQPRVPWQMAQHKELGEMQALENVWHYQTQWHTLQFSWSGSQSRRIIWT